MTRTEERLADALTASYDAAQTLPLRPLTLDPPRQRRWVMLFAPVAAALAVVAVVTGLNALTGRMAGPPRTAVAPPAGTSKSAPRYYVTVGYDDQALVRSAATGKVTGTVPLKFFNADAAVAPTSVNGVYYVAGYTDMTSEKIYRFTLTGAGKVTGFAEVAPAPVPGSPIIAMAVSPDGTKLAVASSYLLSSSKITVITLRGGATRTWSGGLDKKGYQSWDVTELSWAGDKDLAFSALWCQRELDSTQVCGGAVHGVRHYSQLRVLNVTRPGDGLSQSTVLLGQSKDFPYIATAVLSPNGDYTTSVVLSGPVKYSAPGTVPDQLTVWRLAIATPASGGPRTEVQVTGVQGQPPTGAIYQRPTGATSGWLLSPDSTGARLLLSGAATFIHGEGPPKLRNKGFDGEISNGKLISLPPASGELYGQAW